MNDEHAELIRTTHRAVYVAVDQFVSGMGPALTALDGAKIVYSAAVTLMAQLQGAELTAACLRDLAASIDIPRNPRELN